MVNKSVKLATSSDTIITPEYAEKPSINIPKEVLGVISPYPIVVILIKVNQKELSK